VAILIGFAVATVLVIGWCYGNKFTYVFLTLGMLGVVVFTILVGGQVTAIGVVTGAAAFCVIWALALRPLRGPRRENNIVELYGAICDALPRHLAQQLSIETAHGIRVILRPGQTFWFMPNTAVSVIVARIMEETSGCHAMPVPAATPAQDGVPPAQPAGAADRADRRGSPRTRQPQRG
jgi:hypothetical protein